MKKDELIYYEELDVAMEDVKETQKKYMQALEKHQKLVSRMTLSYDNSGSHRYLDGKLL